MPDDYTPGLPGDDPVDVPEVPNVDVPPVPEEESEITGPSSEPLNPAVFTTGTVAAPTIRTAGQGGVTLIVMELIEAYNLYDFTDTQWKITVAAGVTFFAWLQNTIEKWRGKRLVGSNT